MKNALVIGEHGTLGSALVKQLALSYDVSTVSRKNCDYSESSLNQHLQQCSAKGDFEVIVCCIGVLHNENLAPEKSIKALDENRLMEYFRINTVIPSLCLKTFLPLLQRNRKESVGKFAILSAMVGSIEDNELGGWYGYRSSKAALNMVVKSAAIETARLNPQIAVMAIHPGTTRGPLSQPFAHNIKDQCYYTPAQSASRIAALLESTTAEQNGQFLNWNGQQIPW